MHIQLMILPFKSIGCSHVRLFHFSFCMPEEVSASPDTPVCASPILLSTRLAIFAYLTTNVKPCSNQPRLQLWQHPVHQELFWPLAFKDSSFAPSLDGLTVDCSLIFLCCNSCKYKSGNDSSVNKAFLLFINY